MIVVLSFSISQGFIFVNGLRSAKNHIRIWNLRKEWVTLQMKIKVTPLLSKRRHKWFRCKSVPPPFQIRFKSVSGLFPIMGGEKSKFPNRGDDVMVHLFGCFEFPHPATLLLRESKISQKSEVKSLKYILSSSQNYTFLPYNNLKKLWKRKNSCKVFVFSIIFSTFASIFVISDRFMSWRMPKRENMTLPNGWISFH